MRSFPHSLMTPQGDKSKYTEKQKRQAEHIEESYEKRGVSEKEAAARAWATVNKSSGGGLRKGGSGSRAKQSTSPAEKRGKKGGQKTGGQSRSKVGAKRATASAR